MESKTATLLPKEDIYVPPYPYPDYDVYGLIVRLIFLFLGLLTLAAIGYVIYMVLRKRDSKVSTKRCVERFYFYLGSFVSLFILSWAIADLIRVFFDYWNDYGFPFLEAAKNSYYYRRFVSKLSYRMASLLVAVPFYLFHWSRAEKVEDLIEKETGEKQDGGNNAVKHYCLSVMGISGIVSFSTFGWFAYTLFMLLLLGESGKTIELLTSAVYGVVYGVVWFLHFRLLNNKDISR
ncbi:hypothetical protein JXA34_01860 [Patescibacteria group bacterium]|nr:hypothetical protein [Patescibacteria group bacterium]